MKWKHVCLPLWGCVVWNGPFLAQSHWRRSDELQPSKGTEGIVKVAMKWWWRFFIFIFLDKLIN